MDQENIKRINERYDVRLNKHGLNIKTMASGTTSRRNLRFKVLTEVGDLNGKKILDLGCGFGDLISYLETQDISVDYTGVDINPNLIELARKSHPKHRFFVKNIMTESLPKFDYVLSTSCFNLPLYGISNYEFVRLLMQRCYELSNIGFSIDFLSTYVDFQSEEGFHYEPEKIFSIAKSISKKVCLRHDYELFEFNISVYKDFVGWGR